MKEYGLQYEQMTTSHLGTPTEKTQNQESQTRK